MVKGMVVMNEFGLNGLTDVERDVSNNKGYDPPLETNYPGIYFRNGLFTMFDKGISDPKFSLH